MAPPNGDADGDVVDPPIINDKDARVSIGRSQKIFKSKLFWIAYIHIFLVLSFALLYVLNQKSAHFAVDAMDLPLLNPYLESVGSPNFRRGCNFAVAGSTIIPATPSSVSPFSFNIQVAHFIRFKARVLDLIGEFETPYMTLRTQNLVCVIGIIFVGIIQGGSWTSIFPEQTPSNRGFTCLI